MQEETIRKYKEYKFHEDDNFKQLIQEVASKYQNVLQDQHLELFRRKWYQEQIDPTFDINYDGNFKDYTEYEEKDKQKEQQQQQQLRDQQSKYSKLFWLGYYSEGYLKFCFLTSVFGFQFLTSYIGFIICFLALIRQLKMPSFSKTYFARLIVNEFFQNICYLFLFQLFKSQRGLITFLPIMIHCWLGLCECLYQIQGKFYSSTKRFVDLTRNNRTKLLKQKNSVELLIFFWLVIQLFRGIGNFFLVIFYFNYLRVKYIVSDRLKLIVDEWVAKIDQVIESPKNPKICKFILRKIRQFLFYIVKFNTMDFYKKNQDQNNSQQSQNQQQSQSEKEQQSEQKQQ